MYYFQIPPSLTDCRYAYRLEYLMYLIDCATWSLASVSNGSNPLERFRVRVGTGTELFQRFLPHENPDCFNWAGFTTKNTAFQPNNFGFNSVFEFWSYCDMIST